MCIGYSSIEKYFIPGRKVNGSLASDFNTEASPEVKIGGRTEFKRNAISNLEESLVSGGRSYIPSHCYKGRNTIEPWSNIGWWKIVKCNTSPEKKYVAELATMDCSKCNASVRIRTKTYGISSICKSAIAFVDTVTW